MSALGVGTPTPSLVDELATATADCRRALDERLIGRPLPPRWPHSPKEWFTLVHGLTDRQACIKGIARLKDGDAAWPPGALERLALLQSALAAIPLIEALPVDESVKHLCASTFSQLATLPTAWDGQFEASTTNFWEMAMLVTLRRYPAGELVFNKTRLPSSWLLKVHPADLPRLMHGLATRIGGIGPFLSPHLNYWRANRLQLNKTENDRSLWRIARSAARQPSIKGLMADAWFYSAEVGEAFPHLAWLRAFFVEHGAIIVDMELAQADSGVLVGSARRRQLYSEGRFRPRRTLVLWPRADMLAWAERHPELGEDAQAADWRGVGTTTTVLKPRRRVASGSLTAWNAIAVINRHPRLYFLASILLPAMLAAGASAWKASSWWMAAPSFTVAALLFWILQYFLLQ